MTDPAAGAIRTPAVAGLFYPADRARLSHTVADLLAAAAPAAIAGQVRGLLAPHAGYAYSGAVAASAFHCLASTPVETVILIGPSHVEAFDFVSVFSGTHYRTPLGDVAVDTERARALAPGPGAIRLSTRGHVREASHRGEHCIEVELPFLQHLFPDAKIVPIVMGTQHTDACVSLGRAIARYADPTTVVVASSDLSHFHDYDKAQHLDSTFCDALTSLDTAALESALAEGRAEACGAGPVLAMLHATADAPGRNCRVLACLNSGDVTGEKRRVVGYASAVIWSGDS